MGGQRSHSPSFWMAKMKRKYSEEDCRFLADVIPGKSYNEIISLYNAAFDNPLTKLQLKGFIANHGVKTGPPSRYVKGHTPNNKGQHGPQYGYKPTYFKKGEYIGKILACWQYARKCTRAYKNKGSGSQQMAYGSCSFMGSIQWSYTKGLYAHIRRR